MPERLLITAIIVLSLTACGQENSRELVLTGSSTVAPMMTDLAAAFELENPGWRIDVQSGGSSRGIRDARQGLADAGMVSRSLAADETDLTAHTLAYDGIALILHAQNPVTGLSEDAIRRIYRGAIQNWSEFGGASRPIMVINKASGRATLTVFLDYFDLDNQDIEPDLVAGENQQVIQTVARNEAAIGYVSIGTAEYEQQQGSAIKLLPLAGVAATTENVQQGDYALSRPLNIVTRGTPNEALQIFMAFWRTPAAEAIIRQHHFVPATQ